MQLHHRLKPFIAFCIPFSMLGASSHPFEGPCSSVITPYVEQVYQNVIAQGIIDARNAQAAYEHGAQFDQRDVVQVYALFSRRPITKIMQQYPFIKEQADRLQHQISLSYECTPRTADKVDPMLFWASFYRYAREELAKHILGVRFMPTDYETMLENNACSVSKSQDRESLLKKYPKFAAALVVTARLMEFHHRSNQSTFSQIFAAFIPKQQKLPKGDEQLGGMCSIV